MKWTTEARYRTYDSMTIEEKKELQGSVSASPWRQRYHIQTAIWLIK